MLVSILIAFDNVLSLRISDQAQHNIFKTETAQFDEELRERTKKQLNTNINHYNNNDQQLTSTYAQAHTL